VGGVVTFLVFAGWALMLIGGIMFLVSAFREHFLWGFAVLFIPFASLVFLFRYWADAKRPFFLQLLGLLVFMGTIGLVVGLGVGGGLAAMVPDGIEIPGGQELHRKFEEKIEKIEEVARLSSVPVSGEFVGRTLVDVRNELGAPRAMLTSKGGTTYFYPGMEISSEDGMTVSHQQSVSE